MVLDNDQIQLDETVVRKKLIVFTFLIIIYCRLKLWKKNLMNMFMIQQKLKNVYHKVLIDV